MILTAAAKAEEKAVRESELELQAKVHSLQRDLSAQEQERIILQRAVERLQKEKQQMLTDMARQTERTTRGNSHNKSTYELALLLEVIVQDVRCLLVW